LGCSCEGLRTCCPVSPCIAHRARNPTLFAVCNRCFSCQLSPEPCATTIRDPGWANSLRAEGADVPVITRPARGRVTSPPRRPKAAHAWSLLRVCACGAGRLGSAPCRQLFASSLGRIRRRRCGRAADPAAAEVVSLMGLAALRGDCGACSHTPWQPAQRRARAAPSLAFVFATRPCLQHSGAPQLPGSAARLAVVAGWGRGVDYEIVIKKVTACRSITAAPRQESQNRGSPQADWGVTGGTE
jgi:hypothetical protein